MFYVYILKSTVDEKLYIGSTNDLKRRLSEHNEGKVRSTKPRTPFVLKYYESFSTEDDARHREWSLKKNGNALAQLKRRRYPKVFYKKTGVGVKTSVIH